MLEKELRLKLRKWFQRKLFLELYKKFGTITNSANALGVSKGCYCNYHYCGSRYIPMSVIKKLTKILKVNKKVLDENTEEIIDLRSIRIKYNLSKTYDKLRTKYGKKWAKKLREKSEMVWKQKYGKNWHEIISQMGLEALKEKYGERWYEIVQAKARERLAKKFGKNWGKILNRMAMKSLEKKYGKNFHLKLYQLSRPNLKVPLTEIETKFKKLLEENKIPHESHIRNNYIEFDFIIPSYLNPLIICEISNAKLITSSIRSKVAGMLVQKSFFPSSFFFCVLKRDFRRMRGKHYFNPDLGKYLLDKGITIFWSDELQDLLDVIKDIINCDETKILNEIIQKRLKEFETRINNFTKHSSYGMGIAQRVVGNGELKLHEILLEYGSPKGPTILSTKYGGFVLVDNYEECDGTKIVYEITHAKQPRALASLAGKLAYLKDSCNVKTIAVVKNMKESWGLRWLKLLTDKVIKSDDKASLESARSELLNNQRV